jgi:hypothetical protein
MLPNDSTAELSSFPTALSIFVIRAVWRPGAGPAQSGLPLPPARAGTRQRNTGFVGGCIRSNELRVGFQLGNLELVPCRT